MEPALIPYLSLILIGLIFIWRPTFLSSVNLPIWALLLIKALLLFTVTSILGWPYDIQGYFDHSKLIWQGDVPMKDFNSPYSIGFEYLMSFISFNYHSPLFMGLFLLLFEALAYMIILRNNLLTKSEIVGLAFNPLFIHFSIFDIQDEFIILFFFAWYAYLLTHNCKLIYWTLVSILFIFFTKVLSILFIAPLFYKNHKRGFLTLFTIVGIYFILYLCGFRIFSFEFEKKDGGSDLIWDIYSAGNILWILKGLGIIFKPIYGMLLTVSVLVLVNLYLAFNRFRDNFNYLEYYIIGLLLNTLTMLIFYKMTFPYNYLILLFVYIVAQKLSIFQDRIISKRLFAIYTLIISINHQSEYLILKYGMVQTPLYLIFYLIQIMIVIFNLYLFMQVFRRISSSKLGL